MVRVVDWMTLCRIEEKIDEILALTASIVTLLAAVAAAIHAWSASKKADVVNRKVDVVHTMANNRLTEAMEQIARLQKLISGDADKRYLDAASSLPKQPEDQPKDGGTS